MKFLSLFFVLLLVLSAHPALADCMNACLQEHDCDLDQAASQGVSSDSTCVMFHDDCEARCHHSVESYGAVAYGKTSGAWGMSGSFDNKKDAEADAMTYCHQNGSDCKIVMDLYEACAAVAQGDNDTITWGREATAAEAQDEAMRACSKKAKNCAVELWHCYYP